MDKINHYFPNLISEQIEKFDNLYELYLFWNTQINVISRKDFSNFYLNHVLHSLSIAKMVAFQPQTQILDIGTGGGFPGIPLAILFPEAQFHLVDSIGKKIKVVEEVVAQLDLKNVTFEQNRAENIKNKYHFIVSRAVTQMPEFLTWTKGKIVNEHFNSIKNGILYLKGGDLKEELKLIRHQVYNISDFFDEAYFETKKIVYIKFN